MLITTLKIHAENLFKVNLTYLKDVSSSEILEEFCIENNLLVAKLTFSIQFSIENHSK
ncbi:hypothetical protein T190611E02C_40276 [Tenacibaculum sp. 190524A05c]